MARRHGNRCDIGQKARANGTRRAGSGRQETWRSTPLGRELHSHLLMVFLGLWAEWEVPVILKDYGVIDDLECEAIWGFLGAGRDAEAVLKKYVREAYFAHYKRTELLN